MAFIGCSFDSFSVFLLSLKQQNLMKIMFSCIHFPVWPYPPKIMIFFYFILVNCMGWQVWFCHHFKFRLGNFKQDQYISMYFMLFPMKIFGNYFEHIVQIKKRTLTKIIYMSPVHKTKKFNILSMMSYQNRGRSSWKQCLLQWLGKSSYKVVIKSMARLITKLLTEIMLI